MERERAELDKLKKNYQNRLKLRESKFRHVFLLGIFIGAIQVLTGILEYNFDGSGGLTIKLGAITCVFSICMFVFYRDIQNYFLERIRKRAAVLKQELGRQKTNNPNS